MVLNVLKRELTMLGGQTLTHPARSTRWSEILLRTLKDSSLAIMRLKEISSKFSG
jgi:hypothetical protein